LPIVLISLLEETDLLEELDYFKSLNLYYINTANREISLNLAYCRLGYISKKLVKKLYQQI